MSTPHVAPLHVRRPQVNPWLVAVTALAAALVALGSWVLVDRFAGGEGDATTLIDDLNSAWSAGNTAAVASLFTGNAVLTRDDGARTGGSQAISGLVPLTAANRFKVERVAPVVVERDFATTFMQYTSGTGDGTLLGTFQLKEGKILRQWLFRLGLTPPFNNAVIDQPRSGTTSATSSTQGLASPKVVTMLENRIAAWDSGDGKAVAAFYATDGVMEEHDVAPAVVSKGRAQIGARLQWIIDMGLRMKPVGTPVQIGRFVGEPVHFYAAQGAGPASGEGVLVFELDKSGKIAHQWVMGDVR